MASHDEVAGSARDLAQPESGLVSSVPSDELGSYREARAIATGETRNAAGWCPRCNNHRLSDPPPVPEDCRIPDPDGRDNRKWGPAYQTADGTAVKGTPAAIRSGGGRQPRSPGLIKLPGRRSQRSGAGRKRFDSRLWNQIGIRLREDHDVIVRELEAMTKIPYELRSAEKVPLPPVASKRYGELLDHERFLTLIEDGFSVPEAGKEALRARSPQTAYTRLERIREAGTAEDLFRDGAVELFGRPNFPWGHQVADDPWARAFFTRLAGGRDAVDRLAKECKSLIYARNALARYSEDGDVATYQAVLFFVGSGTFGDAK